MKKTISSLLAVILLLSLILCGCGKDSGKKTITVSGLSMELTLKNGETVTVLPLDGNPKSGDIIAFGNDSLKRVIAVEGQELRIDFDKNEVYVDGKKLDEPYVSGITKRGTLADEEVNRVIPEGKVFVLGDKRDIAIDSRFKEIGLVDVKDITGVVESK